MKTLASTEVQQKAKVLSQDGRTAFTKLIAFLESVNGEAALTNSRNEIYAIRLQENMYAIRLLGLVVYFTVGKDNNGGYILILDVAEVSRFSAGVMFAKNDPRSNSMLNPKINSMINPRVNSMINPRVNSMINPKVNSMINPRVNSMINPRVNSMINPRVNSMINPRVNSMINPKVNSSINPTLNRAFGGPYTYNLELEKTGFIVRANDQVSIMFDLESNFTGFLVSANEKTDLQFSTDNEWKGFFIVASDVVKLQYTSENEWVGLCM